MCHYVPLSLCHDSYEWKTGLMVDLKSYNVASTGAPYILTYMTTMDIWALHMELYCGFNTNQSIVLVASSQSDSKIILYQYIYHKLQIFFFLNIVALTE